MFLGQGNLGVGANRVEVSYCNNGASTDYNQDFTFEYDPSDPNPLQLRFEDDEENTLTRTRVFTGDCSGGIEFLEFEINDGLTQVGVMVSNIELDGMPIEDFNGGADEEGTFFRQTCFRPSTNIDEGFTFSGNVAFENSGNGSSERAKIELRVRCVDTD